jgi:hypothetical protein
MNVHHGEDIMWHVINPSSMQAVPSQESDLFYEMQGVSGNQYFPKPEGARTESRERLIRLRERSREEVVFYRQQSSNRNEERNRPMRLARAELNQQIAEAGLNILGTLEEQRGGFRPV